MRILLQSVAWVTFLSGLTLTSPVFAVQDDEINMCIECHGEEDLWEGETANLFVGPEHLADDIHWQRGIKCQQCHGGNASSTDLREAHATEDGFRKIDTPADVPQFCGHCHANAEYMHGINPDASTDSVDKFLASAHGLYLTNTGGPEAPTCLSCHAPHKMRQTADPLSAVNSQQLSKTCGTCHQGQLLQLRKSVHARAGERNEMGSGTLLDCSKCHGQDAHGMLPVDNPESPVFLDHQVEICGNCHEAYRDTFLSNVHGKGLTESGLLVTAVCSSCHGAHGIYYAADRRSTLYTDNVEKTCGKCHHFLLEQLADSIHSGVQGLGQVGENKAPGGKRKRKPTCTDCHEGHDALIPNSAGFRRELPNRCGNCHAGLSDRYRLSLHGELTEFGYEPAAECADCHGAHDIRKLNDPQSRLAPANRVATCQKCHTNASVNFAKYDPHASYKDAKNYPGLHGWYKWLNFLIYSMVGLFALHAAFWFSRSFAFAQRHGRDRPCPPDQPGVVNLSRLNRVIYLFLLVAFVGLVVTGLPLKFGGNEWAKRVAAAVGGFQTTSVWHHFFAITLMVCCAAHVISLLSAGLRRRRQGTAWGQFIAGPDSPVPNRRDLQDFLHMLRWFFGLGNKPKFERWAYWEKFDYWGLYTGIALVGISGLMLWFPNFFCLVLPGTLLNWAKVLHSENALAIAGFVFMIHIFNTHMRPEKFPMDVSWFSGIVAKEHLRRSRPELLQRLQSEGRLESVSTTTPNKHQRRQIIFWSGLLLLAGMLTLVVVVLVNLSQ